jgi:hypothetical protein
MDEKFSYSAQPHAAPLNKKRSKYRNENEPGGDLGDSQNIMYDPRVVRGNTYAAKVMTNSLKREQEVRKRDDFKKKTRKQTPDSTRTGTADRPPTPPAVDGRVHADIQTDDFLEELTDRAIEMDAETQTMAFMDRPPDPLFVVAKTGYDVETQVLPGDLFDFNLEVQPILEVLVGKTLHVAMLELMQEEELEAIRSQQVQFEGIRNIELAEVQRLEAEARRKTQEKEKRIAQETKRLADRKQLEEKIAARAFSQQYLSSLHVGVFDTLSDEGFFYDPVKREVEEIFLPNLLSEIGNEVDSYNAAQQIAEELIEGAKAVARAYEKVAIKARAEARARALEEEERIRKEKEAEEAARKAAELAAAQAEENGENAA